MASSKCKHAHFLLSNMAANDSRANNYVIVKTFYKAKHDSVNQPTASKHKNHHKAEDVVINKILYTK